MGKKRSSHHGALHFLAVAAAVLLAVTTLAVMGSRVLTSNQLPCANSISCIKDLSGEYTAEKRAIFMGKSLAVPSEILHKNIDKVVLGEESGSNKHIYVDLSSQRLYAYEGNNLLYNFLISSGKWYPTPTGDFRIWVKLRYTLMTGGNPAWGTYYYLPNVPFVMFFYNDQVSKYRGFSLHGTYWHHNFGHPMSHGCVNMRTEDAEVIYNWADPPTTSNSTYATDANPGTPITIYGTAPAE